MGPVPCFKTFKRSYNALGTYRLHRRILNHVRFSPASNQNLPYQIRKRLKPLGCPSVHGGHIPLANLRFAPKKPRDHPCQQRHVLDSLHCSGAIS